MHELWVWICNIFNPEWLLQTDRSVERFATRLNDARPQPIRMFVPDTVGLGHQSSTVAIMRQLAANTGPPDHGFAFGGQIDMYYLRRDADHVLTIDKLRQLIWELETDNFSCQVGNARVTVIEWDGQTRPQQLVDFGITGGADPAPGEPAIQLPDLANLLNTRRFLALQPYRWYRAADALLAVTAEPFTGGRTIIDLVAQRPLGLTSFKQRAYFLPPPVMPAYADTSPYYLPAQIVTYLTNPATGIDLTPVYGIRSANGRLEEPAVDRMFQVIAAALASQRLPGGGYDPRARTIVILSCGDFGTVAERAQLQNLINRGLTDGEQEAMNQEDPDPEEWEPARQRRAWLQSVNATAHVSMLWGALTLAGVQGAVNTAKQGPGNVLLIQIGQIPPPLFVRSQARSGWPSVFEGQNTANNAINLGLPYFHVARRDNAGIQYPTEVVGYGQQERWYRQLLGYSAEVPWRVQIAANQINRSLSNWSADPARTPPGRAAAVIRAYRDETRLGSLHRYFARLRDYYAVTANDKLRLGVAFTQYILVGNEATLAAGAESVLDEVYRRLEDNLSDDGELNIAPGAFDTGEIHSFYTKLLPGTGLYLTGAELSRHPDDGQPLVEIEATGQAEFLGVTFTAHISFTAPDGVVIADGRYTQTGRWVVDEIPWLALDDPFISFYTPDSDAPPAGAVGGTLASAGAEVSFRLPAAEGSWQLIGTFADPYPSIRSFYQLAGGVNLAGALPEPFASLAGFGLQQVELVYDDQPDAGQVAYIGFRMATETSLTLGGSLTLTGITAQVTVVSPADPAARSTDWTVRGTFTLGEGTVELSATGPDLLLTGALVEGVLNLGEIVDAFAPGTETGMDKLIVTEFQANVAPATGDYSVLCALNTGWDVTVGGQVIFTIESLEFYASGTELYSEGKLGGYITIDPGGSAFPLSVFGSYATKTGWTFRVVQAPATEFDLSTLVNQLVPDGWRLSDDYDLPVADLGLTLAYTDGFWDFSGRTAQAWTVPFIDDLEVSAELALGYQATGYHVRLETEWTWHNIDISVYASYDSTTIEYGITWGALEGKVTEKAACVYTATLRFGQSTTIGSMIETMVSWATGSRFALEAPWSVLNTISVGGLALEYRFDPAHEADNHVSFTIDVGPLELGFARVDGITVTYNDKAAQKVKVTLKGWFPWNTGVTAFGDTGTLGPWDASAPGAAPAPPGTGNEYLDLRLLALGQHVDLGDLYTAPTVQAAIQVMAEQLPDTEPGQIPAVAFSAAAAWIVGADLGILRFDENGQSGYLLTVQTVFNDPVLYALRLALAGPAAKAFSGLDFQIMYRQVSDTVGVYQAELVLPDQMRRLSIGAYTVTLPTAAVAVYTNGDFQVDVGFPWNGDFGRSFTIEGVIVPGIPVTGAAGFYFGRLSSETTNRVPQAVNGTFSPVLVFGFGLTFGFGKSVQYGPLKAGFSVTASGIVEGVLAAFNPYAPTARGDPAQVQDGYYFWLRGAVGISGRLYGSVDFAVVKADVDLSFSLQLQLTYESYVSMSITVIVSVDVSASISIDLGFFSIRLSFSFSMRIRETFTIANGGTPPWITAGPAGDAHALSGPADRRHGYRRTLDRAAIEAAADDPWSRLQATTGTRPVLKAYLAPGLTVAHNENDTTASYAEQVPCWVLLALIESVPADDGTLAEVLARTAASTDTSFELLAKMALRWAIAAVQGENVTPETLDGRVVTQAQLTYLIDTMLVSRQGSQMPIAPSDVDTFMTRQFLLELRKPPGSGTSSTTAFPIPPAIRLTGKGYPTGFPPFNYTFKDYNALNDATIQYLRDYFDAVAVDVGNQSQAPAAARAAAGELSMAEWVQSDYFLLLTRQMTQAALDSLRDFNYEITSSSLSTQDVADDVNAKGQLTGGDRVSVAGLFTANGGRALTENVRMTIAAGVTVTVDDSFDTLAGRYGAPVTPAALAMANADDPALLRYKAVIVYPEALPYEVRYGDTLITVAAHFRARFADFLSGAVGLFADQTLFAGGTTAVAPVITCLAGDESTFDSLAKTPAYAAGLTGAKLAAQNAARPVLRAGETITVGSEPPYPVAPGDCLADVALAFGLSVAELIDEGTVLTQRGLLADGAVLVLPPFGFTVPGGQTLTSVAERMATTTGALATWPGNEIWPANGAVRGLFAGSSLDVPHLAQYQIGAILDEIRRTLGIHQLSRMAGRYSLHGTRLPTTGITQKASGIWVTGQGPVFTLPPMAGLYALTGQQIPLPDVNAVRGQQYGFVVDPPPQPSWVSFPGGQIVFAIDVDSTDAARVSEARFAAIKGPYAMPLDSLGPGQMTTSAPASYPLTSVTAWQTPSPLTLPYGGPPKENQVQDLRIRALPDGMAALADPRKTEPRFAIRLATYDESTGATTTADVASHGWATVVSFTIRRVPPVVGSPATGDTYEILGAGGAQVVLLERIVDEIQADDSAFDRIAVAYAADTTAAGGKAALRTDQQPAVTFGIAQANLSTETRPPGAAAALAPSDSALMLNTASAFIRLLWEASITRAGGFFLYYYDRTSGRGLPERLFNDRGEAEVSVIVLYSAAMSDRLHDYMTSVVTGVSLDDERSVVFAEANQDEPDIASDLRLSLAEMAALTYSDVGDLAAANAGLKLSPQVSLLISGGVYQVPPGGMTPEEVADRLGTDTDALDQANPQYGGNMPDRLPGLTAVYVPRKEVPAGSGTALNLGAASSWYGVDITALAHHNAGTAGLFEGGQQVRITGGPVTRTATVAPGALAMAASRSKPGPVPLQPERTLRYGELLLENNFSMLGCGIPEGQLFYTATHPGLPAGPVTSGTADPGKVRVAPVSKVWDYRQTWPASRFAAPAGAAAASTAAAGLPDPAASPYRGMGSIFQLQYGWLDYYGNTLITTLDAPQGTAPPWNRPPQLTGYTDPLIGVGAWPSVGASWWVAGDPGAAQLVLSLSFDLGPYQGLYHAKASGTFVGASFTDPLDRTSAETVSNYRLVRADGDETIGITSARLGSDQRSVSIWLSGQVSADHVYVLTVTEILGVAVPGQPQPSYSGSATVPVSGSVAGTSSVTERAKHDLGVYTSLYYQLSDPAGVTATLAMSLLATPYPLAGAVWQGVLGWLFTEQNSIYAFLANRAASLTTVPRPPTPHDCWLPVPESGRSPDQITRLSVTLTLERTSAAVLGDLQTTASIRSASTVIAPATHAIDEQGTVGLAAFAADFERALSVPDEYTLKVAGGVDRTAASPVRDGATLWAIRLGADPGKPISYRVTNAGRPELFAPRPVSNRLISRQAVPIYDYNPVTGIPDYPYPTRKLDFADIDLDVWLRTLLGAVDETLSPAFAAALQIVTAKVASAADYLERVLRAKKTLADWISALMIPLYKNKSPEGDVVREAFRQQLLGRLSNAYSTRAGIQFRADAWASGHDPIEPRLFGGVLDKAPASSGDITLSSPKLPLRTAQDIALPILLGAPEALTRDGVVVGSLELDLAWEPLSIEHQIAKPAGIDGYLASSWLSFVLPDASLSSDLGCFEVPLVLRSFPAGPAMTGQDGVAAVTDAATLAELTRWNYSFSWSLSFHYEQDRMHGTVEFNVSASGASAIPDDLFPELAEFVTVYPQVRADLVTVLAGVDATTQAQDVLKNASVAAQAFVDLLERITVPPKNPHDALVFTPPPAALSSADDLRYEFQLAEGFAAQENPDGSPVRALLITLSGEVPPGIGEPVVLVDPGRYYPEPHPVADGALGFCYREHGTDVYLTEADGQKIPGRTMVLPDLEVFQRQDAWAGARITRNEEIIPGHDIADDFVYTTPVARFAGPMLPTLDWSVPVDLGRLGRATGPRPLEQQFKTLFNELFSDDSGPLTIEASLDYGYRLVADLDPIDLPVFFQPPTTVPVADRGLGSPLDKMADAWAAAIRSWFEAAPPSGADGTLHCDLAILSNLTADPMPLFRLRNLYLHLTDVTPPLPVLSPA
jgi:hypothetical protein